MTARTRKTRPADTRRDDKRSGARGRASGPLPAHPPDSSGGPSGRLFVIVVLLLVLAGDLAYSTSFRGVLVLDDIRAIARNTTIRSFSTALAPPGESTVAGRPVANLSFALNYALAPADVRDAFEPGVEGQAADAVRRNLWGYHALNLAIHLAAGLVLFGVLRRTFAKLKLCVTPELGATLGWCGTERCAAWLALAATLLWLVHPLQTEAVTYVVQRVESLMGLFYLLTLYCAIRAWDAERGGWWAAASVASCALGMATKETMVTAPLVVGLWDFLFAPRPVRASRRWLWAALAATWVILAILVANEHRAPSLDLGEGMTGRYLVTQAGVIVHYLRLAVWPSPLVFLYTWPIASSLLDVLPQVVLVAALVVLTVFAIARRHPLGFAGACFFLVLAPTSSVLPIVTEVAAEHRMYLPLAAVAACVVAGGASAGRHLLARFQPTAAAFRAGAIAGAVSIAVVAAIFGSATANRNRDYWSDEALWRDTVEKQPDNPRARIAYGQTLLTERRLAEAETQLREAVRLTPADPVARGRLGAALAAAGRVDEAIEQLERAVQASGGRDLQSLVMLASAQAETRRFARAAETAEAAARLARAQGRSAMAGEFERRASAYRAMAEGRAPLPY